MKKPLALLLLFLLGLSLAVLAACDDATPEHTHGYTLGCTVLEDEHDISLSYACECGDSAVSSLAVRLTGRTGVAVTVQPDEDGIADCSAFDGEFSVEILLGDTVLYETSAVFAPVDYYKPVDGYEYTEGDEIIKIEYYSSVAGAYKHANVILPPEYDPEKDYPVLYLLHGLQCDEDAWTEGVSGFAMGAQYTVQNAHYFGGVPEMIVVCVNSLVNATETEPEWTMFPPSAPPELAATYDLTGRDIVECLMPYVNGHYSTLTDKDNTAIAGFSMGGREALLTAFAYQDVFGYVGAFSSASFGENVISSSDYVPDFALDEGSDGFRYVQITVSRFDTLAGVSANIHEKLDAIGVEHTYEIKSALIGHSPSVWRPALNTFVHNIFV